MKTIGSIVLVLIAGILSPTNAESDKLFGRSECEGNGGPEAYDNMRIDTENIVNNTIKPIVREILRAYFRNGNGIAPALTVFCGKVEVLSNAFVSYVEAVKPCLKPDDREIPGLSTITTSTLQFLCENRNLVEAIHNSTNRECLTSKRREVKNCAENIFSNRNTTITTNTSRSETTCSQILAIQQCAVRVLGECEDKIFSTTLDSWYKYVNNDIACENLPKLPK